MTPKENFLRAVRRQAPEVVPYMIDEATNCDLVHLPMSEEGTDRFGTHRTGEEWRDAWGVKWHQGMEKVMPYVEDSPLRTVADLERYDPPDPDDPHLLDATVRRLEEIDRKASVTLATYPLGPFERAWTLVGMESLLEMLLTEPEAVGRLIAKIADHHVVVARRLAALRIDIGGVTDDYGVNQGLIMAPALWRRLIRPHVGRLVRVYKDAGCLVNFHSCGAVTAIVPDLIELGIDILNPIQSGAVDAAALKRGYGDRLAFFGGVSAAVLCTGSEAEVEAEVRLRISQMAHGGGYICAADQGLPWPPQNARAFIRAAETYGRYPLR